MESQRRWWMLRPDNRHAICPHRAVNSVKEDLVNEKGASHVNADGAEHDRECFS